MSETKTPDEAAEFVMDRFRPYLPERERIELGDIVRTLMSEWGDLISAVAYESSGEH